MADNTTCTNRNGPHLEFKLSHSWLHVVCAAAAAGACSAMPSALLPEALAPAASVPLAPATASLVTELRRDAAGDAVKGVREAELRCESTSRTVGSGANESRRKPPACMLGINVPSETGR